MKSRKIIWIVTILMSLIGAIVVLRLRSQGSNSSDARRSTKVSVTVTKVGRGRVVRKVEATGTLEGINETDIISETSGKVTKINAEVETYLLANSSVAEVENDLQEIAVEAARANSEKADADLKRVKSLLSQNAVSETQLENAEVGSKAALSQLKLAQKNYDNTLLKTPIAGRLAQKFVVIGQMITPGTKVATVVDDSRMKLKVGIPENFVSYVNRNTMVQVESDALPNHTFDGRVKTIALKADPQTRTFQVEIDLPNDHDRSLKSGMSAKTEIISPGDEGSLVIPVAALIESSGNNPSVYVVDDSMASLRYVNLGAKNDSLVEVVSGISLNDLVVVFGQQNINDGTKVRYALEN